MVSLWVFSWMALPLWGVMFGLYFTLRKAKRMRESLVAKCGGTFLALCSGGLALYLKGEDPFKSPIFWFFLLCMAADALLEIQFVLGMLLFGCAHVCLILWIWGVFPPTWWSLPIWAAVYGVTAFLFRRELPKLGRLTLPFCLYPALLGASLALAAPLPVLAGGTYWPLALGLLSFYVSDMMVAKQELSGLSERSQKPIMLLYWAALYLIAAVLW